MEIITDVNQLHQKCEPVNIDYLKTTQGAHDLYQQIEVMKELLNGAFGGNGIGLAAPQVGYNNRVFILRINCKFKAYINPVIVSYGLEKIKGNEGCLSIPGEWYSVKRSTSVLVRYFDEHAKSHVEKLTGIASISFQHEFDHLEGKILSDIGEKVA